MTKNCLIYEALNDIKDMKVVKKENGLMTLSGVFGVCGIRNNNQRVYETSNYTKMVQEMQERIKQDGGIPGELEHPQVMNITLENISHKITDISIDENGLVTGTIMLLNTPKGKLAQAIVEGGIPLHISSRATGAVDSKTGNVTLERIATYDLVGTPGFSQARLNLNESQLEELYDKISNEGSAEIEDLVYNQISESNIFYIGKKEENNIIEENMEKEILERLQELEEKVASLTTENQELRQAIDNIETPNINLEDLANGIQQWIIEEYSPMVQEWVTEHYSPANNEEVVKEAVDNAMDKMKELVVEKLSPAIQQWVVESYSPEIENWCINELAPGIQKWIIEEYSPEAETWLNESFRPALMEVVNESLANSKKNNLNAIEETLKLLENLEAVKPTYSRKSLISENADEPKFIQEMPADVRVKWDLASNEVKESITRRAKLYNLVNEDAIARFWNAIDFEEIKPIQNMYEGLEVVSDERERAIRAKLRASKFRK